MEVVHFFIAWQSMLFVFAHFEEENFFALNNFNYLKASVPCVTSISEYNLQTKVNFIPMKT